MCVGLIFVQDAANIISGFLVEFQTNVLKENNPEILNLSFSGFRTKKEKKRIGSLKNGLLCCPSICLTVYKNYVGD